MPVPFPEGGTMDEYEKTEEEEAYSKGCVVALLIAGFAL